MTRWREERRGARAGRCLRGGWVKSWLKSRWNSDGDEKAAMQLMPKRVDERVATQLMPTTWVMRGLLSS